MYSTYSFEDPACCNFTTKLNLESARKADNKIYVCKISKIYFIQVLGCYYNPGIYAEGYIVFVFCSYIHSTSFVSLFVCYFPTGLLNLPQSFWLKFLLVSISLKPLSRKHSYLNHGYHIGSALMQ